MQTVALAKHRARYLAADAGDDFERERLDLLGRLMNPMTTRRLERLGTGRGWRCLEVGAGDGSVARWLAERVGPRGHVVATDLNPRFLGELQGADAEVRRHDILHDDLEMGHYDLVHCRALLMHLPEPEQALARMVAALRQGSDVISADDSEALQRRRHDDGRRLGAPRGRGLLNCSELRVYRNHPGPADDRRQRAPTSQPDFRPGLRRPPDGARRAARRA